MPRLAKALLTLAPLALLWAPGCESSHPLAPLHDGLPECAELAETCRTPGQKLGGQYEDCRATGEANDGHACLRVYDECKALCAAADLGEGGAGGEGGAQQGGAAGR